jgi:pyruvate dehydrogenase E2 component (dihydrolipoamide acetyltransferase)
MADVAMPRLSDSMEEGTILKWLKSDGDAVSRGEEIVEIETDKANMTYEADQDGTLTIVAQEGDTLEVGKPIARIGEAADGDGAAEADEAEPEPAEDEAEPGVEEPEAEEPDAEAEPEPEEASRPESTAQAEASENEKRAGQANGRVKASPVAKRMAREMGVDLETVEGTGPGGRIVKADVEAAAGDAGKAEPDAQAAGKAEPAPDAEAQPAPEPDAEAETADVPPAPSPAKEGGTIKGDVTHQEPTRLQQVVARRMAESKATAPDFALHVEVDMAAAVELRNRLKEMAVSSDRPAPSFNDMIVKASALALREFPRANGAYRDGQFELYTRVNVGVAVAGQDALVVPTIHDADRKSLGEIARDSRALAERVRAGAITPPELSGGTFTVSNLGMYGIRSMTPVINPPQAAILGVGAMTDRPVVREGAIAVAPIMELTLVCDHRILYGAEAAEFLGRIRELLEQPLAMAL